MATAAELQTTLAAYRTARDKILAGTVTSVQVEGQSYSFLSIPELEKQIGVYETRLATQNAFASGRNLLGIRGRNTGMGY